MRLLLLLWVAGLVACSGASSTDVDGPVLGREAVTTREEATEPPPLASSPGGSAKDPRVDSPAKPVDGPDAGEGRGQDCATEVEDNDSAGDATELSSCIRGVLAKGDDEDFVTFVAPKDAKRMTISHSETKGVGLTVYLKAPLTGTLVPVATFTDDPPSIPFFAGARYFVRLSARGEKKSPRSWELAVSFD